MSDSMSRRRQNLHPILDLVSPLHWQIVAFNIEEGSQVADPHEPVWEVGISDLVGLNQEFTILEETVVPAMVEVQMSVYDHSNVFGT